MAGVRQPDAGHAGRSLSGEPQRREPRADRSVKFLDPCTKSGVFVREITGRLVSGLPRKPHVQQRRAGLHIPCR